MKTFIFTLLMTFGLLGSVVAQQSTSQDAATIGGQLIDFEVCDPQGGYTYLADYVGGKSGEKYLMVYFWTCSACIRGVDGVVQEVERYGDKLDVVAVNLSNDPDGWAKNYAAGNPFPWPNLSDGKTLTDPDGAYQHYPIPKFPTYVLINAQGKIVDIWSDTTLVAERLRSHLSSDK
jgi:hypothetical protein